tara:strand:+ start:348 stop:1505 length:1158 start_codon:yes stop_codon:yes gene_type:complete
MKLVCSQAELNSALQLVTRAVASRPTHPVLANVLLTADSVNDRLSLTGFDLNLGIQTSFQASVEVSGAITLPARLLGEIVSKLSNNSPITFILDESGEQVELNSLEGSYQMRGLSADDFPDLPLVEKGNSIKVRSESLLEALRATIFASSSDEAKQLLTGVHLKFNEKSIEAAATDGHRLAILNNKNISLDLDEDLSESKDTFSITLPSRSLREIERLLSSLKSNDSINLFYDRGQVVFLASNQIITSRTLEGNYPNYEQLLPKAFSNNLKFNRKDLILALERIAVLADQHNNVVKLITEKASEKVKILADVQDVGSGSETVLATFEGEDFQIAFNVKYVLDGLKAMLKEEVYLRCNAPTTPAIFSPDLDDNSFTYLVMPVQVRT